MIVHVVGRLGAGKTLWAVTRIIYTLLYTDKTVYSNIRLVDYWDKLLAIRATRSVGGLFRFLLSPFPDLKSYYLWRADDFSKRFVYFASFEDALAHCMNVAPSTEGSRLFIWDEVHLDLNAREWKTRSMEIIRFFSMSRKLGFDIIIISQLQGAVDRQLRELADVSYMLKNMRWMKIFGNTGMLVKRWANKGFESGGHSVFLGVGIVRYKSQDTQFYDTRQLLTNKGAPPPALWSNTKPHTLCKGCLYQRFYIKYGTFAVNYYRGYGDNEPLPKRLFISR